MKKQSNRPQYPALPSIRHLSAGLLLYFQDFCFFDIVFIKLQLGRTDFDDIEVVKDGGARDRLIINPGFGDTADIAQVKTVRSLADCDGCFSNPQSFDSDIGFGVFSYLSDILCELEVAAPTG